MTARATLLGLTLTALSPALATAGDWTLRPDPPVGTAARDLRPASRTWKSPECCVLADQAGPFAAIGGWDRPWTIHDLRTGKMVGEVSHKLIRQYAVLSRDGTRLAGFVPGGTAGKTAVVADTASGKAVCRVPVKYRPFDYGFAGRDRVVELFRITAPEKECGVRILDVAAGSEGTLLPGKVIIAPVVSPGGRYVALATKERITVLSVADDNVAARLALPTADGVQPDQRDLAHYKAVALAFSPDGTKLGGIFNRSAFGQCVYWWRLEDGTLCGGYKLAGPPAVEGANFEWSADGSAILVSHERVIDAETGKELWHLPRTKTTADLPRRLLTANQALVVEVANEKTDERRLVVRTRP